MLESFDTGLLSTVLSEMSRGLYPVVYLVPVDTDAIVIISARSQGEEENPENTARIEYGIQTWRQLVNAGGQAALVLNGDTSQVVMMERVARRNLNDHEQQSLVLVDAGPQKAEEGRAPAANTRTQFIEQAKLPYRRLVVVTSNYQISRVARTASANLPQEILFYVVGIDFARLPGEGLESLMEKVKGEVVRIETYVKKGDLARDVRPGWAAL